MGKMKIKSSPSRKAFLVFDTLLMILLALICIYPFWYVLCYSFSDTTAASVNPPVINPAGFTLSNYKEILTLKGFFPALGMSVLRTVVGTGLSVFCCSFLAYLFTKDKMPARKILYRFVVFTMYFAGGLIPNYILVTQWLHLGDTVWAIVLPGAISTFNLLLMKSFFAGLPGELEEAAAMDGMGVYGIFVKIIIPLSKPIIATMCLFYLVGMWNEWFGPFLYLNQDSMKPISLWVRQLVEGANSVDTSSSAEASSVQATLKSATMVLTSAPIICVYPFVQRYFVQGMTMGAVKG